VHGVTSIAFAVAAAFSNALTVVSQHVASTAAPAGYRAWQLARHLVRSPLWLLGVGAMVAAFAFQALALYNGRLSVVQSILVTQLVFSLVIGRFWLHRPVTASAWLWAVVTCTGLVAFLVMREPQGGHAAPTAGAWGPAIAAMAGLAACLTALAARGSPVRRAALYATASATVWATMATFLKAVTDVLADDGPVAVLQHGAIYGVAVSGIVGIVLTQAALHHGPLAVSQPLMVIVNPVLSVILGVWLYGEQFTPEPRLIALGAVGFGAMALGVVFLSRTAPSFEAHEPSSVAIAVVTAPPRQGP